jgi:alpha-amylase
MKPSLLLTLGFATGCLLLIAQCADESAWKSRVIYQILTDRFESGSASPCSDLSSYCGGTWAGIEKQLDYVQGYNYHFFSYSFLDLFAKICTNSRSGMGFDAIWISPMVTNTPNGYHGYWMQDLYGFNPNFGSKSDLQALIQACHSRNMFVMLDVVGNHVGQVDMCGSVFSLFALCHSHRHAGTSPK